MFASWAESQCNMQKKVKLLLSTSARGRVALLEGVQRTRFFREPHCCHTQATHNFQSFQVAGVKWTHSLITQNGSEWEGEELFACHSETRPLHPL